MMKLKPTVQENRETTGRRRIVEVDIAGRELAAVSTALLGDGRGLAIDSDLSTHRIFLQINNEEIYVLSSEFVRALPKLVSIEIKLGSDPAPINLRSKGRIPVAILSTSNFDVTSVDPGTVRFGKTGTEATPVHVAAQDVTGDGGLDLLLHFLVDEIGIHCGDTSITLTGQTATGIPIQGSDSIRTVGCKAKKK
jgi:hypothetical protein